jgi:hypothetical protein
MELRLVRLAESLFQMNQRLFQRSSSVVHLNQSVFPKYQAMILEEPSLGSMSASRCSMTLRVLLDDEDRVVERQCVVVTDEAVISTEIDVNSMKHSVFRPKQVVQADLLQAAETRLGGIDIWRMELILRRTMRGGWLMRPW